MIRTSEASPNETIDIEKYLVANPISGYKLLVENMINFCQYCNSSTKLNALFTGIITSFVLTIKEVNQTYQDREVTKPRNFTFYCETTCVNPLAEGTNVYESVLKDDQDPLSRSLYIDTTPISTYSLVVSVCNSVGCSSSKPVFRTSLGEVPDGIFAPQLYNRTSDSIYLNWTEPKYPSGVITGYILRLINRTEADNVVVYFGLRREFRITNLRPLTNYSFTLEVCNSIGCARSSQVSYSTAEMAPLSVQTPSVLKITQDMIILKWNKPNNDQLMSGFLIGYILYVDQRDNSIATKSKK